MGPARTASSASRKSKGGSEIFSLPLLFALGMLLVCWSMGTQRGLLKLVGVEAAAGFFEFGVFFGVAEAEEVFSAACAEKG